jgi:hypothetical protein
MLVDLRFIIVIKLHKTGFKKAELSTKSAVCKEFGMQAQI